MSKTTANISIDSEIKPQVQALFAELGMDLSTAVNIFLRQALYENAMPFEISREIPNASTKLAMQEVENMKLNPKDYKRYNNVDEMMEEILSEI